VRERWRERDGVREGGIEWGKLRERDGIHSEVERGKRRGKVREEGADSVR
jgi:hypothetical protein